MKKSYHSSEVPTRLATTTRRTDDGCRIPRPTDDADIGTLLRPATRWWRCSPNEGGRTAHLSVPHRRGRSPPSPGTLPRLAWRCRQGRRKFQRPEGISMSSSVDVRKYVYVEEQVVRQNDVVLESPVSRIALGAVFENPLAGQGAAADLAPLIAISEELGKLLTERALDRLGNAATLRAYGKAALVGTDGDLEHGAALIHPRLGMAMRATLRRGRVVIPG